MAIDKPSLNDFLPNGFETQDKDGYKVNFDADKISAGYDKDTLEILSGPNLNNLLDNVGKNTHTLQQFLNFFRDMPIGSFPVVNTSNQLDYKSVNSFFRNVGEIVFSAIPLEDGNLRLLDGSLLEYTMTYSRFISYIAGYRASLPNLFCTQAEFDQSVATYGVCGKFVYDTETKSLRLPKISGFIKGTLDSGSLGDIDAEELPDHTHTVPVYTTSTGADPAGTYPLRWNDGDHAWRDVDAPQVTNASASNPVYKAGGKVQPQAVKEFIYMVVSIDEAEKQVLSAVYNYKGSVENYSDLPTAVAIGEVYNVIGEDPEGYSGANFAWTGEEWDRLGGTVNLSGYLTKTEAGNIYATKASLESNVDYLQGQINTNASNIANIASQEVIDAGIQKIEMLKFASTLGAGKVTDTDLYSVIKKYKYSSFDRSKFTVTGTPNITKDGIVSGFSSSKYIGMDNDIDSATDYEIIFPFCSNATPLTVGTVLFSGASSTQGLGIIFNSSNKLSCYAGNASLTNIISNKPTRVLTLNTNYLCKFKYKNNVYSFSLSEDNGVTWEEQWTVTSSTLISFGQSFVFGTSYNFGQLTSLIVNLKLFKVFVNGQEVFNGRKEGMDIVKDDDFTVQGSPTISADGIASGFSSSNYLYTPAIDFNTDSWTIYSQKFSLSELSTLNTIISNNTETTGNDGIAVFIRANGKTSWGVQSALGTNIFKRDANTNIQINTEYRLKLEFTGSVYNLYLSTNGAPFILVDTYTSSTKANLNINLAIGKGLGHYWRGNPIDLNALKIYFDGNLVYQPLLRIPYTESKTGLKVTDKLDRAIDMAEQCGFSQYFGLDEQNGLCLVPQGDNITGRRELISRVEDSVTHYVTEIYSDLYCRQMGSGTASTAVTLDIPFKDANYKLSVPQSAKSKTGFTPTASCDWIAEGYIYLDEVA